MARIAIPVNCTADMATVLHYRPRQAAGGLNFSTAVYQHSSLPFRVIEGARYRTAQINGCVTCQTWRSERDLPPVLEATGGNVETSFLGRGGAAPDESFYAAIDDWQDSPLLSDREKLAIEFAERMGTKPHSFKEDEAFWRKLHRHYTDSEIVDLTLSIASWIAMGRTLHVLELDPEACAVPVRAA